MNVTSSKAMEVYIDMDLLDDFSGPQVEILVNDIQKLFF